MYVGPRFDGPNLDGLGFAFFNSSLHLLVVTAFGFVYNCFSWLSG